MSKNLVNMNAALVRKLKHFRPTSAVVANQATGEEVNVVFRHPWQFDNTMPVFHGTNQKVCELIGTVATFETYIKSNPSLWMVAACDVYDEKSYREWKISWRESYKNLSRLIRELKFLRKTSYFNNVPKKQLSMAFIQQFIPFANFEYSHANIEAMTREAGALASYMMLARNNMKLAKKYIDFLNTYKEDEDTETLNKKEIAVAA